MFESLYESVKTRRRDEPVERSESNSKPDYRESLEKELKEIAESEMWKAGAVGPRSLRPERTGDGV